MDTSLTTPTRYHPRKENTISTLSSSKGRHSNICPPSMKSASSLSKLHSIYPTTSNLPISPLSKAQKYK